MSLDNAWYDWVITIGGVITAFIVIIGAYRSIKNWLTKQINMIAGTQLLHERQLAIESKLDKILSELSPNGGYSTKDFIKATKEAVSRVESRQQAMLDTFDHQEGVFETNLSGEIIWVNKKLCYMLGKTKEDLMGNGWLNSVRYEHRDIVKSEYDDCINEQREFFLEFQIIKQGGDSVKVKMKTHKMIGHKGDLIGYFGNIIDTNE